MDQQDLSKIHILCDCNVWISKFDLSLIVVHDQ